MVGAEYAVVAATKLGSDSGEYSVCFERKRKTELLHDRIITSHIQLDNEVRPMASV